MSGENLRAITIYLPSDEITKLEEEARQECRSGVSAQIRYVLAQRRGYTSTAA